MGGWVPHGKGWPCLWLAGIEGTEKNMEITILGYMTTTLFVQSFIPS